MMEVLSNCGLLFEWSSVAWHNVDNLIASSEGFSQFHKGSKSTILAILSDWIDSWGNSLRMWCILLSSDPIYLSQIKHTFIESFFALTWTSLILDSAIPVTCGSSPYETIIPGCQRLYHYWSLRPNTWTAGVYDQAYNVTSNDFM
jgi:hypothetical protein